MQECNLLTSLPEGYQRITFTNLKKLVQATNHTFNQPNTNEDESNQFLVVLGLPNNARDHLKNEKGILGVSFRFMWDDRIRIIKALPPRTHDMTTEEFKQNCPEYC